MTSIEKLVSCRECDATEGTMLAFEAIDGDAFLLCMPCATNEAGALPPELREQIREAVREAARVSRGARAE